MTNSVRVVAMGVGLGLLASVTGCAKLSRSNPSTEEEKTLYALGLLLGRNVGVFNLNAKELDIVKTGLTDAVLKAKPLVDLDKYGPQVDTLARTRSTARVGIEKEKAKAFLDTAAKEPGAIRTSSGLVFRTLTAGTGETPQPTDRVKVHYEGKLTDGTEFDSSRKRGQPATFPLGGVIKCWTEGVGKMKVGEKAKLTCPSDIAYGDSGRPPTIPGGATLVFDVELLGIEKETPPPAAPTMPQLTLPPPKGGAAPATPPKAGGHP